MVFNINMELLLRMRFFVVVLNAKIKIEVQAMSFVCLLCQLI